MKTILLEVAPYDDTKSGVNLYIDIKRVLKEFNILDRQFFFVSDSAANNRKAYTECKKDAELNILTRIACIAHNIHNLVYTDIFATKDKQFNNKNQDLKSLMSKLSAIHQGCHCKKAEISDMFKTFYTEEKWKPVMIHNEEFSGFDWDDFFGTTTSAPKLKKKIRKMELDFSNAALIFTTSRNLEQNSLWK